MEAEKLLDFVGLVEDCGGSDLHDHGIGASLDRVVAQLLHFAVDQNFYDAALNRHVDYALFNGDCNNWLLSSCGC